MITNPRNMIRKETYTIDEVIEVAKQFVGLKKTNIRTRVDFDGDVMKMASDRYKCFVKSGTACVCCGLKAEYFIKEADPILLEKSGTYHFNLYGRNKFGDEVLFTKDHIIPRSKGGRDHVDNYQTMCAYCNEAKGNKMPA
jgi:5-methylcytosine-specific restriction endonuclease McrA